MQHNVGGAEHAQNRSLRLSWLDYLPAAAVAQQVSQAIPNVGSPAVSGITVGLGVLVGFGAALALACVIRVKVVALLYGSNLLSRIAGTITPLALTVAAVLAMQVIPNAVPKAKTQPSLQLPVGLKTFVQRQDAQGMTSEDINPQVAEMWGGVILQASTTSGKRGCVEAGGMPAQCDGIRWTETHSIVTSEQAKLVVVSVDGSFGGKVSARTVRVIAIKGTQAVSVGCARFDGDPIDLRVGACAAEIQRVIGAKL